jgi:hypothetical protein
MNWCAFFVFTHNENESRITDLRKIISIYSMLTVRSYTRLQSDELYAELQAVRSELNTPI